MITPEEEWTEESPKSYGQLINTEFISPRRIQFIYQIRKYLGLLGKEFDQLKEDAIKIYKDPIIGLTQILNHFKDPELLGVKDKMVQINKAKNTQKLLIELKDLDDLADLDLGEPEDDDNEPFKNIRKDNRGKQPTKAFAKLIENFNGTINEIKTDDPEKDGILELTKDFATVIVEKLTQPISKTTKNELIENVLKFKEDNEKSEKKKIWLKFYEIIGTNLKNILKQNIDLS